MKVVLMTLFAICIFLFLDTSFGRTMFGDVLIDRLDNGLLNCDSLICPKGAKQCRVSKQNDPNDFETIVRQRTCYGQNGVILQEQTVNEPNKNHIPVNMNVMSGGGGSKRPLTPEEKKKLDEVLEQSRKNMQAEMKPFGDGSFAAKLQKEIQDSFKRDFPMAG